MESIGLADLPLDVLLLIAPYLTARDFLALTSTCRHLHHSQELRFSPSFWSRLTRHTFRVPNQPVVEADGRRWMRLYRRMHTQSRIFNWGKNDGGCFGGTVMREQQMHSSPHLRRGFHAGPRTRATASIHPTHASWPQMTSVDDVGIVADLQCGGWSTVMLNSRGCLYINGKVSDLPGRWQNPNIGPPKLLSYPPGFTSPAEREHPSTAVEHFSAGRAHVLALSDNGTLWTWSDANHHALQVKFLGFDTYERSTDGTSPPKSHGRVTKVRAGFGRSSAYVKGKGIVVWEPVDNGSIILSHAQGEPHAPAVVESVTIPNTGYLRPARGGKEDTTDTLASEVGQVRNWVVLGQFILFITDLDKVFAVHLPTHGQHVQEPFQITTGPSDTLQASETPASEQPPAADVQGSHERFAIILRDGQVLTADQDTLFDMLNARSSASLKRIPSLQHTGVISIAFGDYHFLALHADGNITAHGKEPGSLGALGLGNGDVYFLRGIIARGTAMGEDGELLPECETTGRRVCFDQSKYYWMWNLGEDEHTAAFTANPPRVMHTAVASEWVEQKLRAWDSDLAKLNQDAEDQDGLDHYFTLSVAAGGWHSGAIVLVSDEKKKEAARKAAGKLQPAQSNTAATSTPHEADADQPGTPTERPSSPARPPTEPCFNCTLNDTFCSRGKPMCEQCRAHAREPSMACTYPEQKDWWLDTLPRLRMPDGDVLPGNGPVSDWTCPEFVAW